MTERPDTADRWAHIAQALTLLALNPRGLGGLWLRARSGPARDHVMGALSHLPSPHRRLHPAVTDEQLFGGVDLDAALTTGHVSHRAGVLDGAATVTLTMAERSGGGLAARLAMVLDGPDAPCLIALDEGDAEDTAPDALCDRMALRLDLDGLSHHRCPQLALPAPAEIVADIDADAMRDLVTVAQALGVASTRAVLFAVTAAKTWATSQGRATVASDDLAVAVTHVLAPRATQMPTPEAAEPDDAPAPPPPEQSDDTQSGQPGEVDQSDILLEAARAVLPPDLLARLAARARARGGAGSGAGARTVSKSRGRPAPSRPGAPGAGARLDLLATMRAAAPWQRIRKGNLEGPLAFRRDDFRIKRYLDRRERLIIFAVDASGSAARTRLAEAKGAVELLLAEAYARRDQVALIAFRREGAEVLLPPTRSLVMTKRRLSALPGGGGTPLAAGLQAAMTLALAAKGRGMTPSMVLLTDGRANIALDGAADRPRARADAEAVAGALRAAGVDGFVIDLGRRPEPALQALAVRLDAPYLPLPRADATTLSSAITAGLGA